MAQHKRQSSSLHGHFKGLGIPEKEGIYGQTAPDLPPRIDRAVKPMGLLTTAHKIPNGRSAHERLFGTKPPDGNNTETGSDVAHFSGKLGSLERSQNSKSDSLSSYDSFNNNNNNAQKQTRIIPNAHDDLKTTLSKIEPTNNQQQQQQQSRNRWDQQQTNQHRHERLGSKLDLKYVMPPSVENLDQTPRNSLEREQQQQQQQQYRYSRSPAKQTTATTPRHHVETKTDYGKYSRNNSSAQDYAVRSSHQDLTQAHLSVSSPMKNGAVHSPQNTYKPVPPPKPKNYKPPYKGQPPPAYGGGEDGMMQPPLPYQHGKSHSNPVVSFINHAM